MLKTNFLQIHRQFRPYQLNLEFAHNIIELFGMDSTLSDVRRKARTIRQFVPNSSDKAWWVKGVNIFGMPLLVAVLGLAWFLARRSTSIRYEREYLRKYNIG